MLSDIRSLKERADPGADALLSLTARLSCSADLSMDLAVTASLATVTSSRASRELKVGRLAR
jgi:hypothetical protein